MVNSNVLGRALMATVMAGVSAQTAPGFSVQASSQSLEVTYGSLSVTAGDLIPRSELLSAPTISTPAFTSGGRAVLLMVDSDVPRNGTRVELLHWLVSNVTLSDNSSTLVIPTPGEAEYRPPNPPIGDTPHAYTFILFAQPDDFSVPEEFNEVLESRVFFNTSNFVAAAGLEQPGMAANYLRVQNLSSTPTQTFPPPRPTNGTGTENGTTSPTPSSFPGAASPVLGGGNYFWAGVGTAIIAGVAAIAL